MFFQTWGPAYLLTLGCELPVVALLYPGQRRSMVFWAFSATTVTHLGMFTVLALLISDRTLWLISGEVVATLTEAVVLGYAARPRNFAKGLAVSALANTLSFLGGLVVF